MEFLPLIPGCWVIQCSERFRPLLNLLRDRLLESPLTHCDETRVQVLKEEDRDPTGQSWMQVQASGLPHRKVVLFDYTSSLRRTCRCACWEVIAAMS